MTKQLLESFFTDNRFEEIPLSAEASRLYHHLLVKVDRDDNTLDYRRMGEHCFRASYPEVTTMRLTSLAMEATKELQAIGAIKLHALGMHYFLTPLEEWIATATALAKLGANHE